MYALVIFFDGLNKPGEVVATGFGLPEDAREYAELEFPGRTWEAQLANNVK